MIIENKLSGGVTIFVENTDTELLSKIGGSARYVNKGQKYDSIEQAKVSVNEHIAAQINLGEGVGYTVEDELEPVYNLEVEKMNKVLAIDARTSQLIKAGFTYDGQSFSMSENAQRNWTALASALGFLIGIGCNETACTNALAMGGGYYPISTVDEETYYFTSKAAFDGFFNAYLSYQSDPSYPLGSGRVLKAQVSAATNQAELEAVVDNR